MAFGHLVVIAVFVGLFAASWLLGTLSERRRARRIEDALSSPVTR